MMSQRCLSNNGTSHKIWIFTLIFDTRWKDIRLVKRLYDNKFRLDTFRSDYCNLNKGECNLNQSKCDSFLERDGQEQ